jgi:hypothetical protein
MVTLHDFKTEAAEYGLAATVDRLAFVRIVDDCGRVLLIESVTDGLLGECWTVDVFRNAADLDGGAASVDGGALNGMNVRQLFAHALQIADRVSTVATCADCERGYGPGAACRCTGR